MKFEAAFAFCSSYFGVALRFLAWAVDFLPTGSFLRAEVIVSHLLVDASKDVVGEMERLFCSLVSTAGSQSV